MLLLLLASLSLPPAPVQIQSLQSGLCVQAMGTTSGSSVQLYPCSAIPAQLWMPVTQSDGSYRLVPESNPALAIATPGNSSKSSVLLQVTAFAAADIDSRWTLAWALTSGYLQIAQAGNKLCFDDWAGLRRPGAPVQQYRCYPNDRNQQWKILAQTANTSQAAPFDPVAPITSPSYSLNSSGATITWSHDPAGSLPAYGATEGATIFGLLSQPATAIAEGTLANGTLTQMDPMHIAFTANPSILPCHVTQGLQPLPCDEVFFARVDSLPWISSHWIGDGSGYAEDGGKYDRIVQGDPVQGTGWYTALGPAGSTCIALPGGTTYAGTPGSNLGGGGPSGASWSAGYDCHVVFPASGINFGGTTQATVLDGTEGTWTGKAVYTSYAGPFPDVHGQFKELRESGNFVNSSNDCNVTGTLAANPAFLNCAPGGAQPYYYPTYGGIDAAEYLIDPLRTWSTWEIYNTALFGSFSACQVGGVSCTLGSGRHIDWHSYDALNAVSASGTPQSQKQLMVMDLAMAATDPIAYPIQHAFALTEPLFAFARTKGTWDVWPALYFSGYVNYNNMGALEGERKRLDPSRASLQGGLSGVKIIGFGSGYPAGAVIQGTVTGCQSIDGAHQAQVNAFIGPTGGVFKSSSGGQVFAYVINTGINCVNPQAVFPPSPAGGETITATLSVWNLSSYSQAEQNILTALFNQATQYGMEVNDVGFASNETFRTETQLQAPVFAQYHKAVADFYGSAANAMGDGMLWGFVDTSSLLPRGGSWPKNMFATSWLADGTNPGAHVPQNVIQLTTSSGVTSFNPVPVLGVAVGFNIPNLANRVNILAGETSINLAKWAYVTGDPKAAGVTFSWITDPCPNLDTLTSSGMYTSCTSVPGNAPLIGEMRVASIANPAAWTSVWITVMPSFDSSGTLSIDVGGNGGCVNGASFTAGTACNGAGTTWSADCPSCFYWTFPPGYRWDYPHWPSATWGGSAAPQSVAGESTIYQSYTYGNPDLTMSVVVPNGNYSIRALVGSTNRCNSAPINSPNPAPYCGSSTNYTTQGQVQRWAYCMYCQVNYQVEQPVDITLPAKVSDNILKLGIYGYSPSRWIGWDRTAHGGGESPTLSGLQIRQDTTTTPHWEIGSYVPGMPGGAQYNGINGNGDNFTVPLSNGTPYSVLGAPQPGILQLYLRDVLTGIADVQWSLFGAGTITAAGLYTAPTAMPPSCDTVTASSISQPSLTASQQICFTSASQ